MAGTLRFYTPFSGLPRPSETGIGEQATVEENNAVQKVIEQQGMTSKRKAYTAFTGEQRAKIVRFAAKNGNATALKKFRGDNPDLEESTVHLFKQKYVDSLTKCPVNAKVISFARESMESLLLLDN